MRIELVNTSLITQVVEAPNALCAFEDKATDERPKMVDEPPKKTIKKSGYSDLNGSNDFLRKSQNLKVN